MRTTTIFAETHTSERANHVAYRLVRTKFSLNMSSIGLLTVSVKNNPLFIVLTFFTKWLGIFSPNFACLLYVPIYAGLHFLFYYLQHWRSYAILSTVSTTTIIFSKCPPSAGKHAVRSHLISYNFVKVGDNWIQISSLAWLSTCNRCVKFGRKIPNCSGNNVRKPQGIFLTHTVELQNSTFCVRNWWYWSHIATLDAVLVEATLFKKA